MGSDKRKNKVKDRRKRLYHNGEVFNENSFSTDESCEQSIGIENLIRAVDWNSEDVSSLCSSAGSASSHSKTRKKKKKPLGSVIPADCSYESDKSADSAKHYATDELCSNLECNNGDVQTDSTIHCDGSGKTFIVADKKRKKKKKLLALIDECSNSEKSDPVVCTEAIESNENRFHHPQLGRYESTDCDNAFHSSPIENCVSDYETQVNKHGKQHGFELEKASCNKHGVSTSAENHDSSTNFKQKKAAKKHSLNLQNQEDCSMQKAASDVVCTENYDVENGSNKIKIKKKRREESSAEIVNGHDVVRNCENMSINISGTDELKHTKKKHKKNSLLTGCKDKNVDCDIDSDNSACKGNSALDVEHDSPSKYTKKHPAREYETVESKVTSHYIPGSEELDSGVKKLKNKCKKKHSHLVDCGSQDVFASASVAASSSCIQGSTVDSGEVKKIMKSKKKFRALASESEEKVISLEHDCDSHHFSTVNSATCNSGESATEKSCSEDEVHKKHKQHSVEMSEHGNVDCGESISARNNYVIPESTSIAIEENDFPPKKKKHKRNFSAEVREALDERTFLTTNNNLATNCIPSADKLKHTKKKHMKNSLVTSCTAENVTGTDNNSACTGNLALDVECDKPSKKYKKKQSGHRCESKIDSSNFPVIEELDSGVNELKNKCKKMHSQHVDYGSQDLFDSGSVAANSSCTEATVNKTKKKNKKKFDTLASDSEGNAVSREPNCDGHHFSTVNSATCHPRESDGTQKEEKNCAENVIHKKHKKRKHRRKSQDPSEDGFENTHTANQFINDDSLVPVKDSQLLESCLPLRNGSECKAQESSVVMQVNESWRNLNEDTVACEINVISSGGDVCYTEKSSHEDKPHKKRKKKKHSEVSENSGIANHRSLHKSDEDCFDGPCMENQCEVVSDGDPVPEVGCCHAEFQERESVCLEDQINSSSVNGDIRETDTRLDLSRGYSEKNDGIKKNDTEAKTPKKHKKSKHSEPCEGSRTIPSSWNPVSVFSLSIHQPEVLHGDGELHRDPLEHRRSTPHENGNVLSISNQENSTTAVQISDSSKSGSTSDFAEDIHASPSGMENATKQAVVLDDRTLFDGVPQVTKCQRKKFSNSAKWIASEKEELPPKKINIDVNVQQYVDLDSLDMTVEPLDFKPPYLHSKGIQFGKLKDSKEELKSEGITVRSGRWTKKEDNILRQNWQDFVRMCGIKNPLILLGVNQRASNKQLQKFSNAKQMLVRLGKGLNDRTLYSIYLRARAILCPRNDQKLTEDEVQTLTELHAQYGNNWAIISEVMDKPSVTCRESFRWHSAKVKDGKWSKEEDEALIEAMSEEVGEDMEVEVHSLPWDKIAAHIPSRNSCQCRVHWLQMLCNKSQLKRRWSKEDEACLIYWMHRNLQENRAIDWDGLYEKFQACSASYVSVQRKWLLMKKKVPFFNQKDHEDIVNYMYRNYLPSLLSELGINMKQLESIASKGDLELSD